MGKLDQLFDMLWTNYTEMTPLAANIKTLLEGEGEFIENDHIALRTFNLPETGIDTLAKAFIDLGYEEKGEYHFEEKKLYAKHYEHKTGKYPKVFISELLLEKFSETFQQIVKEKVNSVEADFYLKADLMVQGRPWDISIKEYHKLIEESDYGAWVVAIGFRPNHFTVFINSLTHFNEVSELNTFLKNKGIKLNESGGEVKGSPEVYLEQSSTLADSVEITFKDGIMEIPSCYFEFAKRYPLKNGELYQGFVAGSADKIFESTSKGQK